MGNFYVQVIEYGSGRVVKEIGPMTGRRADKVEWGIIVNLSDEYYTIVVEKENQDG